MKIAFLGLGIMGSRMAANLAGAGHELTVWNRTQATAEEFARQHHAVAVAASPRAAATGAELVITMVVDGPQVAQLTEQAAAGAAPGTLFVDCSTIGPAAALAIGAALAERGMRFLDAPVTGSSPRAEDGTLTFMVGGQADDFARALPVFQAMGELSVHAGPSGQGQVVKVINNTLAAINAAAVGQALLVASKAGADLDAVEQVVGSGSGASTMMTLKAGPMRAHDYSTLFKLDHMLKDVRLCLAEAAEHDVPFSLAGAAEAILAHSSALGHGEDDFAALLAALEQDAGTAL
jgi:3-hydroxyisobutyrate dehydrogenase-like beta-hydroxyacid dehydrogenase